MSNTNTASLVKFNATFTKENKNTGVKEPVNYTAFGLSLNGSPYLVAVKSKAAPYLIEMPIIDLTNQPIMSWATAGKLAAPSEESTAKPSKTAPKTSKRTKLLQRLSSCGVAFDKSGQPNTNSLIAASKRHGVDGPFNAAQKPRMIKALSKIGKGILKTSAPTVEAVDNTADIATNNKATNDLTAMVLNMAQTVSTLATSVASLKADLDAGGDY
jgi:hypothetical protein